MLPNYNYEIINGSYRQDKVGSFIRSGNVLPYHGTWYASASNVQIATGIPFQTHDGGIFTTYTINSYSFYTGSFNTRHVTSQAAIPVGTMNVTIVDSSTFPTSSTTISDITMSIIDPIGAFDIGPIGGITGSSILSNTTYESWFQYIDPLAFPTPGGGGQTDYNWLTYPLNEGPHPTSSWYQGWFNDAYFYKQMNRVNDFTSSAFYSYISASKTQYGYSGSVNIWFVPEGLADYPPTQSVFGYVTSDFDSSPISGALITISASIVVDNHSGSVLTSSYTDGSGFYQIGVPYGTSGSISASNSAGSGSFDMAVKQLGPVVGGEEVDFTWSPTIIYGFVLDNMSNPIVATLDLSGSGTTMSDGGSGFYQFNVNNGYTGTISASYTGTGSFAINPQNVSNVNGLTEVDFTLNP